MVDPASRVQLPAAQVQDRGDRLAQDRTAAKVHDIGLVLRRARDGQLGFEVMVGGGMGRTPYLGTTIREHLPVDSLLSYLSAVLRVYNRHGRRDNIYKARIKILVASAGRRSLRPARSRRNGRPWTARRSTCPTTELARIRGAFSTVAFEDLPPVSPSARGARAGPIRASPGSCATMCCRTRWPATRWSTSR